MKTSTRALQQNHIDFDKKGFIKNLPRVTWKYGLEIFKNVETFHYL